MREVRSAVVEVEAEVEVKRKDCYILYFEF